MIDNPEQSKTVGREKTISFGRWSPYAEANVKETGILGEFITINRPNRRDDWVRELPNLKTTRILHQDGTVDEIVVDTVTHKVIPEVGGLKRINGRIEMIEIGPKSTKPILKFTEVSVA